MCVIADIVKTHFVLTVQAKLDALRQAVQTAERKPRQAALVLDRHTLADLHRYLCTYDWI